MKCRILLPFLFALLGGLTAVSSSVIRNLQVSEDEDDPSVAIAQWTNTLQTGDPVTVVKVKWTNGERNLDVIPQDCSTHGNCRLGITDLPPNTLYKIQIQVRLTTERGIALTRMSEVAVYMTKPEYLPATPRGVLLRSVSGDHTKMNVSWSINARYYKSLTGYALTVRNSRGESRDVIAPPGATHAIVDQLTPSTTYFVKVSLNNKFGKTSTSETAALFTTEGVDATPGVTNVQVVGDNADLSRALISWDVPNTLPSPILYAVWHEEISEKNCFTTSSRMMPASRVDGTDPARPAFVSNLRKNTLYKFYVQSISGNGMDTYSKPVYYKTAEDFSPSSPRMLRAVQSDAGYQQVAVTWASPEIQNGRIIEYLITWQSESVQKFNRTTQSHVTLSLAPETSYLIEVRAVNSHNFTSKPAAIPFITKADPHVPITGVFIQHTEYKRQVKLQWSFNRKKSREFVVLYGPALLWETHPPVYGGPAQHLSCGSYRPTVRLNNTHLDCGRANEVRNSPNSFSASIYIRHQTTDGQVYGFQVIDFTDAVPVHRSEVIYFRTATYVAYPVKDVKVTSNYGNVQISWRPSAKSIFGDQFTVEYYSLDSRTGLVEKQTSRKPTTSLNTLNLSGIEKGKVYFFTVKSTPLHSDKPAAYSDYVEFKRTP